MTATAVINLAEEAEARNFPQWKDTLERFAADVLSAIDTERKKPENERRHDIVVMFEWPERVAKSLSLGMPGALDVKETIEYTCKVKMRIEYPPSKRHDMCLAKISLDLAPPRAPLSPAQQSVLNTLLGTIRVHGSRAF